MTAPANILVVDDDPHMVRTLCDVLRGHGFSVRGVFSGEEALAAIALAPYAAVVMDVRMSGISGVEAAEAMRRSHGTMPVILTTAYALPDTMHAADSCGVERVLEKPFDPRQLLRALHAALHGGASVLVVDDDPTFLKTLADALAAKGLRTLRARSVSTALDLLHDRLPRIVLLDLVLQGNASGAAVRAIHDAAPAVPLVLYSGHRELLAQTAATLPADWLRAVLGKVDLLDRLQELIDDCTHA